MTERSEQAEAGWARDLISGMQAMRRGDDKTAEELFNLDAEDMALVLGWAIIFITRALEGSGQDVDAWLAARMGEFGEA